MTSSLSEFFRKTRYSLCDIALQNLTGYPNPNSVIILDWDDTLCPTTYLTDKGYNLRTSLPEESLEEVKELETTLVLFLTKLIQYGKVYIISNSINNWVEASCHKWFPNLINVINKIEVKSARARFEHAFPNKPVQWKYCAFLDVLRPYLLSQNLNVISMGDLLIERDAIQGVTSRVDITGGYNSQIKTKSIKFVEKPTIKQLIAEIELVSKHFNNIHNHQGDMDLQMTVI